MTVHVVDNTMSMNPVRMKRFHLFFDWSMAGYFFLVSLLDATIFWYWSTYFSYFIAFIFLLQFSLIRGFRSPEFILYLTWTVWLLLTSVLSSRPDQSLEISWLMAKINLMTVILLLRTRDIAQLKRYCLFGLVGATIISATIGIFGFREVVSGGGRLQGMSEHVNRYGYVAFNGVIYAVLLFINSERPVRMMATVAVLVITLGLLGSGSRAPAVAGVTMGGVYLLLEYARKPARNIPRLLALLVILLALLYGGSVYFESSALVSRIEGVDESGPKSTENRMYYYKEIIELSTYHPVFGYGVGNYNEGMSSGIISGMHGKSIVRSTGTHSAILEIIYGTGYIGLLLFLPIFAFVIYRLEKSVSRQPPDGIRKTLKAMQAAMIAILVYFFMANGIQNKQIGMTIGMIAGFALVSYNWAHKETFLDGKTVSGRK